ncbi:related to 2-isopropylmalate synthase 2, mitochondrial [Saccharomycodes ludwigii]|uniref:2-isopropylmalate synthase n=1 Tax=Saccharomycodes ludwigii TaxID=36035 RepID=A0A376B4V8_9ASCO|nr:related to 2-isopropylmalate synthase 2, mitochondrial [Saccharomycodes ludwigii]
MIFYKDPSVKYKPFENKVKLSQRDWPSKTITKAPRWLATDLRDGNQSLPDPMTFEEKKIMLKKLIDIGYKEIEVAFPSASEVDFTFTQYAVQNVPRDVAIQVLAPCREELITKTITALKGCHKAIVHIYLATSACFRHVIFNDMTKAESIAKAVKCTTLVKNLTKKFGNDNWALEFSPETFSDTDPEFVVQICNAVQEAWGTDTSSQPLIFNLPATVEMSTPNIYADQVEYFHKTIKNRENICISLHPHNDRGCAVAACELAQMAGADRVEGCLFGNGERTGNVDLVTLALNLYTQGIMPNLDFSDINSIIDVVERCNKIPIHARHPYGGQLVVCAFSGSHQDAIKKGFALYEKEKEKTDSSVVPWKMPYLPLDPQDIGRTYEAIIRVNSQSGKGGSSWVILKNLELDLPRKLQVHFSTKVQKETELKARELKSNELIELFMNTYFVEQKKCNYKLVDYNIKRNNTQNKTDLEIKLEIHGCVKSLKGSGNGPISSFINAINEEFGTNLDVHDYSEHSLGKNSKSRAVSYISMVNHKKESNDASVPSNIEWGVGIHESVTAASFWSVISCLNSLERDHAI